ncbi:unnamed protein product [Darwinula stevensoni]|uniref:Uncharacterized protein n=1 Tax=Darwinula stevensoni TaxID=69355 RepID=A0A7R8X533_9CRUS|nr:unnamed protein product [Darwinula stevensoni]CAG0884351.1 unnamed protein product [Darwinula stevensoni]
MDATQNPTENPCDPGLTCHPVRREGTSCHVSVLTMVRLSADSQQSVMQGSLLLVSFLLASGTRGQAPCPDPDLISPCVCSTYVNESGEVVTVDCSNATTSGDIFSAFNDVEWPFAELTEFRLISNERVDSLPDGAFGGVSFQTIFIHSTALNTIHPSAVLSSKDRLELMRVTDSFLTEFPWDALSQLSSLARLDLQGNALMALPAVQSPSLEDLLLLGSRIPQLQAGWSTPNMKYLEFDQNPISEFPPAFLDDMENLVQLWCRSCGLGPTLPSGSLQFHSEALVYVVLDENGISRVEPGAITGLTPETRLDLWFNEISELSEESFRPMLEILSLGNGYVDLFENPVVCDCSMAWIVLDPAFLASIDGFCTDGTWFIDLDPDFFQEFCVEETALAPDDFWAE